ncbi:MAG: hypothetical protein HQ541_14560 [Mariniphaga sp.]|nr:hypothetical protein [Mariniphaga sp.]
MGNNFNGAYKMLPQRLRNKVKDKLTTDVFMVQNLQTFYNKKNGKELITDFEWRQIEKIFEEYGINAKTGKLCQIAT